AIDDQALAEVAGRREGGRIRLGHTAPGRQHHPYAIQSQEVSGDLVEDEDDEHDHGEYGQRPSHLPEFLTLGRPQSGGWWAVAFELPGDLSKTVNPALLQLPAAFGLAGASGLNATLPLFLTSLLARLGYVHLS